MNLIKIMSAFLMLSLLGLKELFRKWFISRNNPMV